MSRSSPADTEPESGVFTAREWQRYQRQIQLGGFGAEGQVKLKRAKIVIVGMGGLGVPAALYLAGAGVGSIEMIDADTVSRSNLHRQVLYTEADIGKPKVLAAKASLSSRNPEVTFVARNEALNKINAESIFASADLILDCSDNFAARYLINDTCLKLKKPWVFASIAQYAGQLALLTPKTACFRCLYPQSPTNVMDCNSAGVLGVLPGFIGLMQATEALKYLTGLSGSAAGELMLAEPLNQHIRHIRLSPDPTCICQGSGVPEVAPAQESIVCSSATAETVEISISDYERDATSRILIDIRTDSERRAFNIGGAHIPFHAEDVTHFVREFEKCVTTEKTADCILYCQSGVRSKKAVELLREQGFSEIKSLAGGLVSLLEHRLRND